MQPIIVFSIIACILSSTGLTAAQAPVAQTPLQTAFLTWLDLLEDLFPSISAIWDYPSANYARFVGILSGAAYDSLSIILTDNQDFKPLLVTKAQISNSVRDYADLQIRTASVQVAICFSSRDILNWVFPAASARINETLYRTLPSGFRAADHQVAITIGTAVAARYKQLRENDGFEAVDPIDNPKRTLGSWEPTPPAFRNWTNVGIAGSQPFTIISASSFRVPAPPVLASALYADSLFEVKIKGSLNGSTRTQDEADVVSFWTMDEPAARWLRFARRIVSSRDSPSGATGIVKDYEEIRLYAMMGSALVDAIIANFESKLFYYTWRPVTAIRKADQDDNAATSADPNWLSLRNPDPSPEYPSAVSSICAACAKILINHFNFDLDVSALPVPFCEYNAASGLCGNDSRLATQSRTFKTIGEMVQDCARSRVLAGVHFSFSTQAAIKQAYNVSDWVYSSKFDIGEPTPVDTETYGLAGVTIALIVIGVFFGIALIVIGVLVALRVWRTGKAVSV